MQKKKGIKIKQGPIKLGQTKAIQTPEIGIHRPLPK